MPHFVGRGLELTGELAMTFQTSLKQLITDSDEQNTLWRALMQSMHDHGGSTTHLDALLDDAKCPRLLLDEISRMVIGKIWKLAEEPIDLGLTDNDFQCSPKEFLARFPNIEPYKNAGFAAGCWSETKPKEPCRYRLYHFGHDTLFSEIVTCFEPNRSPEEHASWRELIAYVARLQTADFCGCPILAAGSRLFQSDHPNKSLVESTIFPVSIGSDRGVDVAWRGTKHPDTDKFDTKCFWLIRVYD